MFGLYRDFLITVRDGWIRIEPFWIDMIGLDKFKLTTTEIRLLDQTLIKKMNYVKLKYERILFYNNF